MHVCMSKFTQENIYITGSIDALQNWSTSTALLLSSASYPVWSITVNVPASTTFQYKYIRINNGVGASRSFFLL